MGSPGPKSNLTQIQDHNMEDLEDNGFGSDSSSVFNATPQSQSEEPVPEEDYTTYELLSLLLLVEEKVITLRQEGHLDTIIKGEDIAHTILRISEFLPILPVNLQLEPLLSGIGNLCQKVNSLTTALEAQTSRPPSLQDSIHAPRTMPNNTSLLNSTPQAHLVTDNLARPDKKNALNTHLSTPMIPRLAHHYTRLVVQFLPNGIPNSNRWDPSKIVMKVNSTLSLICEVKHLKVVAASYNKQGNIILSSRADQTAAELAKFEDAIKPVLVRLSSIQNVVVHEDKKWFKVQVDGVNTGSLTIGEGQVLYSGEKIHDELSLCNPLYAQLTKHIVAKLWWLQTSEELRTTLRSSLVFAMDDEQATKNILSLKVLAAFGSHCSLRAFQERLPVLQCCKCWRFDHTTEWCQNEWCCQICSGPHAEQEHQNIDPLNCNKCMSRE